MSTSPSASETPMGAKCVFLDRDGVINRSFVVDGKPYAPRRAADFRLLPGSAKAIATLKQAGFKVVVVTNQPDIGNGLAPLGEIQAMHGMLAKKTRVDEIIMCPHRQTDGCTCRKPKPGMLLDAAARLNLDLARSYMVGDRTGDMVAGALAGCYTIFIHRGYREGLDARPDATVSSLPAAVRHILSRSDSSVPT